MKTCVFPYTMKGMLKKERLSYVPKVPPLLRHVSQAVLRISSGKLPPPAHDALPHLRGQNAYELVFGSAPLRKLRIGVVFSGGQAAGGHNVISGLWDALQTGDAQSELFGFLGGPSGIVEGRYRKLTHADIDAVRNMGGFDLLGSGRTKIETKEQMEQALHVCNTLALDGCVIIGGDDSNTNAAILANYFLENSCKTKVVGVPKTIDGDLQSPDIPISFGFDSACKVYAEMIGNIARDALSSKKYYHFIKLMGRSASHIALECALLTHPNLTLIGEEKKSLGEYVQEIVDLIVTRNQQGKDFGVILIPEGLIEFIPDIQEWIPRFPEKVQKQLLLERDPHGNIAVSQIETESLLLHFVEQELKKRTDYRGKFSPLTHFFGYEGRSCYPSNFDANYCYSLGILSCLAIRDGVTGMIASIQNLHKKVDAWHMKMVPITHLMHWEERKGKKKLVIQKTLVDLQGPVFAHFASYLDAWRLGDHYLDPGPMQFFGPSEVTDTAPRTLSARLG